MRKALPFVIALALSTVWLACNGSDTTSGPDVRIGPPPRTTATPVFPPLEGPARTFRAEERTNYRKLTEFQLPDPTDLPSPAEDQDGPEFQPPAKPECPPDWEVLRRPAEGFQVCYPAEWMIDGHGYVTTPADDRWYAVGLYRFGGDGRESAHVSIYATGPYSQPPTYVADCEQAYRVTLSGQEASLCPDYPGEFPEAKIIAYHVRRGEMDYFINVVTTFEYDSDARGYLDSWSKDDEDMGIRIAQTIQFMEVVTNP